MHYVISERRERLGTAKEKIFDILLTPAIPNTPPKRVTLAGQDWQTFAAGDTVGYRSGKLWHKELPDQPVEAKE